MLSSLPLLLATANATATATATATPCQGPCPVEHITCGGNYGRSFREQGPPCPPPTWEPAWPLNQSTIPGPYSASAL